MFSLFAYGPAEMLRRVLSSSIAFLLIFGVMVLRRTSTGRLLVWELCRYFARRSKADLALLFDLAGISGALAGRAVGSGSLGKAPDMANCFEAASSAVLLRIVPRPR